MKTKTRKGFTLVELVIVIAVIAILAAVLIPTFSSLVKKANESADIQAAREMNTALALDGAETPTSLVGLYDALEEVGLTAKDYTPLYKNRCFYWVKGINQVIYYDNKTTKIVFPKNITETNGWYSLDGSFDSSSSNITFPDDVSNTYTFVINTAADFVKAAELVSEKQENELSGKTIEIKLNNNIDLQGADVNFSNKINGKLNVSYKSGDSTAHTITGLCITDKHGTSGPDSNNKYTNTYCHSLFYIINELSVENINIKDSVIIGYGTSQSGFFASQAVGNVTFKNVEVKDCDVQGENKVGVLFAYGKGKIEFNETKITNCNTYAKGGECGIVFGVLQSTITENIIKGTVNITNSTSNLAEDTKVITKTYNGVEYTMTEYVKSNGDTKHRVTTAEYGFYQDKGETIGDIIITFDGDVKYENFQPIDSNNVNSIKWKKN